jgi:hypothetical protein
MSMGELAAWLRTVSTALTVGYSLGALAALLFCLGLLVRLSLRSQMTRTGAPDALEKADGDGSHHLGLVAGTAIVLLAGALAGVVWADRNRPVGESVVNWLRTVTTVGYSLGVLGGFLFFLSVLSRLGSQVTWTAAPDAAFEKPIFETPRGYGSRHHVLVAATAIALFGGLAVLVWAERIWPLGEWIMNWLQTVMTSGLLLVLMGSGIAYRGLRRQRAGDLREFVPGSLGRKLVAWNVAPAGGVADLERRVLVYQQALGAVTAMVTGLTIALAGVAESVTALVGSPALSGAGWLGYAQFLALLVGIGIGYPIAARLEQRKLPAGPRNADLRRRRLADYRSPRLRWLVLGAVFLQTATAGTYFLGEGVWVVLLMPLLGALAFVVGELHMWSAARVARTVVTDDPAAARRCDDLVRAGVIANLQTWQLFSVAFAGLIGAAVAASYARTGGSGIMLAASSLSAMYCLLCAVGLLFYQERLGGRVTGWGDQPMPE